MGGPDDTTHADFSWRSLLGAVFCMSEWICAALEAFRTLSTELTGITAHMESIVEQHREKGDDSEESAKALWSEMLFELGDAGMFQFLTAVSTSLGAVFAGAQDSILVRDALSHVLKTFLADTLSAAQEDTPPPMEDAFNLMRSMMAMDGMIESFLGTLETGSDDQEDE